MSGVTDDVCGGCRHGLRLHWWCIRCGYGCEGCQGLCEHHRSRGGTGGVYRSAPGCEVQP